MTKLKIHIVNYEQALGMDAILTKYARMLERELIDLGHDVTVSGKPEKADINHHINFISYIPSGGIDTTMITHLTGDKNQSEEVKVNLVKNQLKTSNGICMNQGIKDKLVEAGCDEKKLSVALHAHDSMPRRPLIIALTFSLYPDGRKREEMITKLFKTLDRKDFIFRVMGRGWKDFLEPLRKLGIQAQGSDTFTADWYQQILLTSDYILYTGDEDSLGQSLVDAKNAGLRIIAPPNKELEVEYPFNNQKELNEIFRKLVENPVKAWTWGNYAIQHETLWKLLKK